MLTTIDEAEADLQKESGKNWKLITSYDAKRYKSKTVVAMCLDRHCRQLAYFVPVDAMPKRDIFETALNVAKQRNTGFMPVIQCNLDGFPEVVLPPVAILNFAVYIKFKPTGCLALQPIGHRNPMTYSVGKIHNLRVSAFSTINNYLSSPEWETKITLDTNTGDLILSLVHKNTNQSATVSLKIQGDEVTGSITFNNAKFRFERWNFSGSYGLQITGKVLPDTTNTASTKVPHIATSNSPISTTETIILVVGISVLGVLTDGAGFGLLASI